MGYMDDIFLDSMDRWADNGYEYDERMEYALTAYEEWSKNLNNTQKKQLAKLIEGFQYYSSKRIDSILSNLHKQAVTRYAISNNDTVVSVVRKKNGMLGSSSDYWLRYQLASGMSKRIFYDTLDEIGRIEWENISKVVFVDDCSGSGETFIKFLGRQKQDFSGKLIILLTIEMMKEAERVIKDFAKTNGLWIECIYYNLQDKALKVFSSTEVDEFVQLSQSREINKNEIKGYKFSEALMAFYNNTPNNTLGIFRCTTPKNTPLFPRKNEEEAGWKRNKFKSGKRKRQQYNAKVIGEDNGL